MPGLHKTLSRAFNVSSAPVAILSKYLLLHLRASGMRYISHFRHARFHLEQEIERVAAISRAQAEPHEMLNQHHRGAGLVRRKSSINGPEKSKISKISKMAPWRPSSGMQMA